MKIIITGALGHIGSSCIRKFSNLFNKLEIIMIDDLSTQRYCSLFNLPKNCKYKFIENKLQNCNLNLLLPEVNVVLHLAATTDAAGTAENPELIFNNNLQATNIIAEACLNNNIPLIFPSSTSVYGSQDLLVDENCKELQPQSPYASCKIQEEDALLQLSKKGLKVIICRLGTIYGTSPGMRFHTAVNKFCWQAVMGQNLTVWETAMDQKRPYLDLCDAVNAFYWIVKNNLYDSEIYNIVTSNYTVREVTDIIKKHVSNLEISLVKHKIMNQLSYEVSNKKFLATGFKFVGNLRTALQESVYLLKGHEIA